MSIIPTDPKKAAKIGQAYGEVLGDLVVGIAKDVQHHKAKQAYNKAAVEANKNIAKNNAILREIAVKQIAQEQMQEQLMRMSPAQREEFRRRQAQQEARARREAEDREETWMIIKVTFWGIFSLLTMAWIALIIYGIVESSSDYAAYNSVKWVPGLRQIVGR